MSIYITNLKTYTHRVARRKRAILEIFVHGTSTLTNDNSRMLSLVLASSINLNHSLVNRLCKECNNVGHTNLVNVSKFWVI